MKLVTVREAAFEFENIILARDKISAINNIIRRYKIKPVIPATSKTSGRATRYNAEELEEAIEECYSKPGNNDRFRAFKGDLQNIDFRKYDAKDKLYGGRNESYNNIYNLTI